MVAAQSTPAKSPRRSQRLTPAGQTEPTATTASVSQATRRGSAKKAALAVQVDGNKGEIIKSGHKSPRKPAAASISEVLLELDELDTDEAVMRANAKLPLDTLLNHLNQLEVSPALPVRTMVRGLDRPAGSSELLAIAASTDAAPSGNNNNKESSDRYLLSRRQTADVSELHRLMDSSFASSEASDVFSRRPDLSPDHSITAAPAAAKVHACA